MPKLTDTTIDIQRLAAIADSFREIAAQIESQIAHMQTRAVEEVVIQNWTTTEKAIKDCQKFAGLVVTAVVDAKLRIQTPLSPLVKTEPTDQKLPSLPNKKGSAKQK